MFSTPKSNIVFISLSYSHYIFDKTTHYSVDKHSFLIYCVLKIVNLMIFLCTLFHKNNNRLTVVCVLQRVLIYSALHQPGRNTIQQTKCAGTHTQYSYLMVVFRIQYTYSILLPSTRQEKNRLISPNINIKRNKKKKKKKSALTQFINITQKQRELLARWYEISFKNKL